MSQLHLITGKGLDFRAPLSAGFVESDFHRPPGLSCLVMGIEGKASNFSLCFIYQNIMQIQPSALWIAINGG